MNRSINNYNELVRERNRLKELLQIQRNQIREDLRELKEEFRPVLNVSSAVGKLTTREQDGNHSILSAGTNLTIDLITTKWLAKSNFLVRLFLPSILKNLSSHYIPKATPVVKRILGKSKLRTELKQY